MQHVGVGEDEVGAIANPRAIGGWGIAVVDAREQPRCGAITAGGDVIDEREHAAQLVLREGLGGKQHQRARRWILERALEDRQQIREGLAARRAGGDDDVLAGLRSRERLGLVTVELVDAASDQALAKSWMKRGWEGREGCRARSDRAGRDHTSREAGEVELHELRMLSVPARMYRFWRS